VDLFSHTYFLCLVHDVCLLHPLRPLFPILSPPLSTLFPYTTLFRSVLHRRSACHRRGVRGPDGGSVWRGSADQQVAELELRALCVPEVRLVTGFSIRLSPHPFPYG